MIPRAFRYRLAAGTLALLGAAAAVQAQVAAPPAATLGNPLNQLPTAPANPSATRTPQVDVQAPQGAAAGGLERQVTATRFDIEGVKALPFADVARIFMPLVGQPLPLARLVAASREATALYAAADQPLSFVFLPEQNFAGGVVRVVAVEAYVANIRIEGDAGPGAERLRLIAEQLQDQRPLRRAQFERVTQLLGRLPGLKVVAEAALPGTTDGATTLVLKVTRKPYNVSVGADLRQPRSRAVLSGSYYDPFGSGSELSASTLIGDPKRERLFTIGASQLVGSDGLSIKANLSSYRGYPDNALGRGAATERYNTQERVDLSASYPLWLSAQESLALTGGFYAVDNIDSYRLRAQGQWLSEEARIRAFYAQLAYAKQTATRSRQASLMLARGIDGAGADARTRSNVPGVSGPGTAKLDFTRLSLDLAQRDRFANQWGTAVMFGAQYSPDTLAATERVSFGGPRYGRGYAAGDGAGDRGAGVGLELNRLFKLDYALLKQVEPYLLVEAAKVSTRIGVPAVETLRSVALGIRLSDARHYSLDLAIAKPTGDPAPTNPARKPRLTVMLSYQLDT
ncbi:conserved exported hypothetical protein [Burkholderiales bacterium 8X]|nr:conserved exported hypothetical protein [Burkholderiales bacterium 8X]